ncbi:hypothetical protein [Streptomyces sp. YGL11-2]|uniref:hypothetical protein n=1 Tax=Streptomyces sp. YGL11-2 TaxID=3414028 RepID=UPI003CEC989C
MQLGGTWLYLACVLNIRSRRVLGWSMATDGLIHKIGPGLYTARTWSPTPLQGPQEGELPGLGTRPVDGGADRDRMALQQVGNFRAGLAAIQQAHALRALPGVMGLVP